MSLCNVCSSIPFRTLITYERHEHTVGRDGFRFNAIGRASSFPNGNLSWNERRSTIAEIVSRAKTCPLCAFVLLRIKQKRWFTTWERGGIDFTWEEVKAIVPRNLMVYLKLPGGNQQYKSIQVALGDPHCVVTHWMDVYTRVLFDNPLREGYRATSVVLRETLHPKTLERMLSWLDKCNTNHVRCRKLSTRQIPLTTRVLDVSMLPAREQMLGMQQPWRDQLRGENLKLLQSSECQTGQYAALSYCWGTTLPLTTTTINLKNHELGISFNKLPRTLQDAVMITRLTGFEYIWIDCLCILQDSKKDWEHESAHMADVYSNASLTLAASRAEHCGQGFLGPRELNSPLCVDIKEEGGSFNLFFQTGPEPIDEPLNGRGWAAQERVLSSRVLSFETGEITWKCLHGTNREEKFRSASWADHHFPLYGELIEGIAKTLSQPMDHKAINVAWYEYIEDYTRREVSFDKDTLPATAGLVRKVQELTGDTYYAGLWRSHFLKGLLWHFYPSWYWSQRFRSLDPNERSVEKRRDLRKRQEWTAPSWSWASVKGSIWRNWQGGFQATSADYCAHLEECSIAHSGLDPFGQITAGFASIRGPITLLTRVKAEEENLIQHPSCKLQLGNGTLVNALAAFDFVHYISCSALMITGHLGICIEKVEGTTDTYTRIGTVEIKRVYEDPERHTGDSDDYTVYKPGSDLTAADHLPARTIILL